MFQLGFSIILVFLVVGAIQILFNSLCLVLAFKIFDPNLDKEELVASFLRAMMYWLIVFSISFVAILIGGAANSVILLLLLLLLTAIAAFILMMQFFALGAGEAFVIIILLFIVNYFAAEFLTRFVSGLFSVSM